MRHADPLIARTARRSRLAPLESVRRDDPESRFHVCVCVHGSPDRVTVSPSLPVRSARFLA